MKLEITQARSLTETCMRRLGHDAEEARIIADHLVDAELRGLGYAGLARALSVVEKLREGRPATPIAVVHETPLSARLDGGGQAGYLVGERVTRIAIRKAKEAGVGIAAASNTWFTGMFAYYMEMATRENLVAMAAGSSAWRVAPHGSSEARFGTNPIAFGFPSDPSPVILDAGTSAIMVSEATQALRAGTPLRPGLAFDAKGDPTTNPASAFAGAFAVWGGNKGSGLALVVQLFGLLCDGGVVPSPVADCSMFILSMKPDLLVPADQLRRQVTDYAEQVRRARPIPGEQAPRMPFDRSFETRRESLRRGWVEVSDPIVAALKEFAAD